MDIEEHLSQIEGLLAEARHLPLSSLVVVDRDALLGLLDELRADLPEELRQARWVIKERDELLAAAGREAAQVREEARAHAQRLVEDQEVVRVARREAERIQEEARERARTLRLEAEDYVDTKLASFEEILSRTLQSVAKGRERLRGPLEDDAGHDRADDGAAAPDQDAEDVEAPQFFDQERWR